jgi:hypothetical protein
MSAGEYDFSVNQGASVLQTMTWKDSGGSPVDIGGYTIRMQVRKHVDDEDTLLDMDNAAKGGLAIVGDGSAGQYTVTVSATDTADLPVGTWVYDLEMESGAGFVTRLLEGDFAVKAEVTR